MCVCVCVRQRVPCAPADNASIHTATLFSPCRAPSYPREISNIFVHVEINLLQQWAEFKRQRTLNNTHNAQMREAEKFPELMVETSQMCGVKQQETIGRHQSQVLLIWHKSAETLALKEKLPTSLQKVNLTETLSKRILNPCVSKDDSPEEHFKCPEEVFPDSNFKLWWCNLLLGAKSNSDRAVMSKVSSQNTINHTNSGKRKPPAADFRRLLGEGQEKVRKISQACMI